MKDLKIVLGNLKELPEHIGKEMKITKCLREFRLSI
jgi:hypothetical protein